MQPCRKNASSASSASESFPSSLNEKNTSIEQRRLNEAVDTIGRSHLSSGEDTQSQLFRALIALLENHCIELGLGGKDINTTVKMFQFLRVRKDFDVEPSLRMAILKIKIDAIISKIKDSPFLTDKAKELLNPFFEDKAFRQKFEDALESSTQDIDCIKLVKYMINWLHQTTPSEDLDAIVSFLSEQNPMAEIEEELAPCIRLCYQIHNEFRSYLLPEEARKTELQNFCRYSLQSLGVSLLNPERVALQSKASIFSMISEDREFGTPPGHVIALLEEVGGLLNEMETSRGLPIDLVDQFKSELTILNSRLQPHFTLDLRKNTAMSQEDFNNICQDYERIQNSYWSKVGEISSIQGSSPPAGVSRKAPATTSLDQALAPPSEPVLEGMYHSNPISEAMITQAKEIIRTTPCISYDYTRNTSLEEQVAHHEEAKDSLKEWLSLVGSKVQFISSKPRATGSVVDVTIPPGVKLDGRVFDWEATSSVSADIERDGKSNQNVINLYGVESQFNAGQAFSKFTIAPGNAVMQHWSNPSQGSQAQLAYSNEQSELINCAANKGFNGLINILDQETKEEIAHGHLTPSQERYPQVLNQLKQSGHKIEYPCVCGVPEGGTYPVYEMLISAPAFGEYLTRNITGTPLTKKQQDEIAFLCALHGWRVQFEQSLALARETGKPVHCKPAPIGLGDYGTDPEVFSKALYKAAKEYEEELRHNDVKVTFQVSHGSTGYDPKGKAVAERLLVKRKIV